MQKPTCCSWNHLLVLDTHTQRPLLIMITLEITLQVINSTLLPFLFHSSSRIPIYLFLPVLSGGSDQFGKLILLASPLKKKKSLTSPFKKKILTSICLYILIHIFYMFVSNGTLSHLVILNLIVFVQL